MDQVCPQGGIQPGPKVLSGILANGTIDRVPVQGLTAEDDGHFIFRADGVRRHALAFWEEPVTGDAAKRGIFCLRRVIGTRVGEERIAAAVRLLSKDIDITFYGIFYFHFETDSLLYCCNCLKNIPAFYL